MGQEGLGAHLLSEVRLRSFVACLTPASVPTWGPNPKSGSHAVSQSHSHMSDL